MLPFSNATRFSTFVRNDRAGLSYQRWKWLWGQQKPYMYARPHMTLGEKKHIYKIGLLMMEETWCLIWTFDYHCSRLHFVDALFGISVTSYLLVNYVWKATVNSFLYSIKLGNGLSCLIYYMYLRKRLIYSFISFEINSKFMRCFLAERHYIDGLRIWRTASTIHQANLDQGSGMFSLCMVVSPAAHLSFSL